MWSQKIHFISPEADNEEQWKAMNTVIQSMTKYLVSNGVKYRHLQMNIGKNMESDICQNIFLSSSRTSRRSYKTVWMDNKLNLGNLMFEVNTKVKKNNNHMWQ